MHKGLIKFEKAAERRDSDAMIEANREFHLAIAKGAANEYVTSAYDRLLTQGLRLSRMAVAYDFDADATLESHLRQIIKQHREMVQLVEGRDAAAAEALGGVHARLSLKRITMNLMHVNSTPIEVPREIGREVQ